MNIKTAVYIASIKHGYSFSKFRTLAEWLDCYEYLPKESVTNKELPYLLLAELMREHSIKFATFRLSDMMYIAENRLTESEQQDVVNFIKKVNINRGNN